MRKLLLGVAAIGVFVTAATVVNASIPGPDGTISACYRADGPAQGNLVVIDSTESCPTGFTALNWSATALPGYEIVVDEDVPTDVSPAPQYSVACPSGKIAVSGGDHWDGYGVHPLANARVISSYPSANGAGWEFAYYTSNVSTLDLYVICVNG